VYANAETTPELPGRLIEHLRGWVGAWPPTWPPTVVGNPRNAAPGWDGKVHAVIGIIDDAGRAAIGVPPDVAARLQGEETIERVRRLLPGLLGRPGHVVYQGVFRWSTTPAPLPDAGVWIPVDDPVVPPWLHPFGGEVLMALDDDGRYLAGVGIKRHDDAGRELAVVTERAAQGRGLARRLVAQAARRVLDEGAVPTYLHAPANVASARVADAAGFPDHGWSVLGMGVPPSDDD